MLWRVVRFGFGGPSLKEAEAATVPVGGTLVCGAGLEFTTLVTAPITSFDHGAGRVPPKVIGGWVSCACYWLTSADVRRNPQDLRRGAE